MPHIQKQITLQTVSDYGYVSYDLTIDGRVFNYLVFEEVAQKISRLPYSFKLTVFSNANKKLYTIKRSFEDFDYEFKFNSDEITSKSEIRKIVKSYSFTKFDKTRMKDQAAVMPERVVLSDEDASLIKTHEEKTKESLDRARTEVEKAKVTSKQVIKEIQTNGKKLDILKLPKLEDEDEIAKTQLISLVEVNNKKIQVNQTKKKLKAIKKKAEREPLLSPKFTKVAEKHSSILKAFKKIDTKLSIMFSIATLMFISLISLYAATDLTFNDYEPSYKKAIIIGLLSLGLVSTCVAYIRVFARTRREIDG